MILPSERDFPLAHELDQPCVEITLGSVKAPSFEVGDYGIKGVGKSRAPFVNFDPFVDHSRDQELHEEALIGLALSTGTRLGTFHGAVPAEEMTRLQHGQGWTEQLRHIEQHDPTGQHRRAIEFLCSSVPPEERLTIIQRYAYFAMGAPIPWFFTLTLLKNDVMQKRGKKSRLGDGGSWTAAADNFPKLREYVQTLPFQSLGRVIFFATYPRAGVTTHRDANMAEHSDHSINFFFTGGSRPSFVYDPLTREKIYVDPSVRTFFFNNRDFHGVDPEPNFRYTLRVDGQFTDELCEKIGLEDGYTWRWSYEK